MTTDTITDLVALWGSCFGAGLAIGLLAICISYPFQIIKQGIEQI